jgi:hypothetical protein
MQAEYGTSGSVGLLETELETQGEGRASSCVAAQLTNMKMEKSERAILNGFMCGAPFVLRRRRLRGRYRSSRHGQ